MKVGLVCLARMENLYIRDFIKYYKKLGVANIILGDNAFDGDREFVQDVIQDFIDSGFVIIEDIRNKPHVQTFFYDDMYYKYVNDYDFLAFFDIDEYLYINNYNNINDWLSQEKFQDYYAIAVNWMVYGDSNKLYYDNVPVYERLTIPIDKFARNYDFNVYENQIIKSIINCKVRYENLKFITPHRVNLYTRDTDGNLITHNFYSDIINYNEAHLKHYSTKTIEEYIKIKLKRGIPDRDYEFWSRELTKDDYHIFFRYNEKTEEKLKLIERLKNSGV